MINLDLWMAGTALALFIPQLVFVPLMQGAMDRRTGARVQIIRQLSVSAVEATNGDDARDQTDDAHIDRVFELNMGIFRLRFTMNFLMNLSTQLQLIAALLVGIYEPAREEEVERRAVLTATGADAIVTSLQQAIEHIGAVARETPTDMARM
jgi:hypothetical protein